MVSTWAIPQTLLNIEPLVIRNNMSNGVENYGWTESEGPESCGYIAPKILELLTSREKTNSICDLGSGNGALAGAMKDAGLKVCGVEYDSEGCRIAREKFPDIHFYNLGVQDNSEIVTAVEGKFDAVVSTEVIEHLFSPHLLPHFAKGLLRDNGLLIVSTPYHGFLKNLALSIANKWDHHHTPLWHGGHIKFWSKRTLTTLLTEGGFEVIEFHGVGRLPFLWKSMILVARVR